MVLPIWSDQSSVNPRHRWLIRTTWPCKATSFQRQLKESLKGKIFKRDQSENRNWSCRFSYLLPLMQESFGQKKLVRAQRSKNNLRVVLLKHSVWPIFFDFLSFETLGLTQIVMVVVKHWLMAVMRDWDWKRWSKTDGSGMGLIGGGRFFFS